MGQSDVGTVENVSKKNLLEKNVCYIRWNAVFYNNNNNSKKVI